ncbi:MAG: hypothetical protein M3022_19720 [Actinomycetota bacterium]|nr:hypothetical protein [Actinomycetota bacterium]
MAPRFSRLLYLAVVGALLITAAGVSRPAAALADGDPASDVLLGDNVFYPYSPAVPRSVQIALNAVTAKAKAQGFPLKVALIAAPTDLGVIPDLFGKPQLYAKFLDQEISFTSRQRLLVVMAAGYGLEGFDGPAQLAARGLALPAGKTSADLARAALIAVPRLAAASGHPIRGLPSVPGAGGQADSSGRAPVAIGLAVSALLVAALVILRRRTATHSPS